MSRRPSLVLLRAHHEPGRVGVDVAPHMFRVSLDRHAAQGSRHLLALLRQLCVYARLANGSRHAVLLGAHVLVLAEHGGLACIPVKRGCHTLSSPIKSPLSVMDPGSGGTSSFCSTMYSAARDTCFMPRAC